MDKFKAMTIFLKIVETGNFSQAAKQLNIPPASVSYHLSNLEESLGVVLFNRTTRKVSLTDSGRNYADRCRYILTEVEETENILKKDQTEPKGTLNLSVPTLLGTQYLGGFISEFMKIYPKVNFNITVTDKMVNLMEEGTDVAIRISKPLDSSLLIRKLSPIRIIYCASPDYLERHGEPKTLAELNKHNCLRYSHYNSHRWQAAGPMGFEKVKISGTVKSNNDSILKSMAMDGHGIIYTLSFIVYDELLSGKLKQILRDYQEPGYFIHALYPHSRRLSAKSRVFLDFLSEKFKDQTELTLSS